MKFTQFAACAVFSLACVSAYSQENTVRVGIVNLTIHSEAPNMSTNGPAFLTPQPANLKVGDATTLLIAYTRKLDEHLDIDVLMGLPPSHDVYGAGTLAPFGVIAHVKQVGPTALLNYNFGRAEDKFRPFVGAGVNYTHFYDAQSTDSLNLASGGPTKIELKDSIGWAFQLGARYKLADQWSLVGSVVAAKVKSEQTATTGSIERKTTIDFRPIVYMLGVGYSF